MCGIAGIKYTHSKSENNITKQVSLMTNTMTYRGPDDSGTYISRRGNTALGHRRLSILDLSPTGHQPMYTPDGNIAMVFNGEIYNHLEIKNELLSLGYTFRGHSDSETVLYGYAQWGDDIFTRLNGIFAIAIYDEKIDMLILARDRFGVKPLYLAKQAEKWLFASEIKAILKGSTFNTIHPQSLHEFMYYGYPMKDRTLYHGISKVMPGQIVKIDAKGKIQKSLFWKPEDILMNNQVISEKEAVYKTKELLENAVRRQLISDVPVGVFLSGGIDSGAMVAFASKHYSGQLKTYSAGFDFDGGHNELPLAAKMAKRFGTDHTEMMIEGGKLPDIIEKLVWHHDAPFSDAANIPLYLMTKAIGGSVKVILQGDGGDEMFAGYTRYHLLAKYWKYKLITGGLNPIVNFLPNKKLREQIEYFYPLFAESDEGNFYGRLLTSEKPEDTPLKVLNPQYQVVLQDYNPFAYFGEIAKRFSFLDNRTQKLLWLDTQIILPDQFLEKVDKSTMANSIEIRVPFLDNELSAFAMRLPAKLKIKKGIKKYILKKALEGILPNEVLYGPKKGFGVPYQNWLKEPLYDFMQDTISSFISNHPDFLNAKVIEKLMTDHRSGKKNHGFLLWKVLNLAIWVNKYKMSFDGK